MRMKRCVTAVVAVLLITAMLAPAEAFAAPRVLKTTMYESVVKSGNVVYVAGGEGLYKVWLNRNGSKKTSKLLRRYYDPHVPAISYGNMKKHGDYIYVNELSGGTLSNLVRINVKTGKRKWLATSHDGAIDFAIYNNKLYYSYVGSNDWTEKNAVMNLDGTNAKRTTTRVSARHWVSTTRGYYARVTDRGRTVTTYLKTPRGLYKLGSHNKAHY